MRKNRRCEVKIATHTLVTCHQRESRRGSVPNSNHCRRPAPIQLPGQRCFILVLSHISHWNLTDNVSSTVDDANKHVRYVEEMKRSGIRVLQVSRALVLLFLYVY